MAELELTVAEQDEFLELVLPCANETLYQRELVRFGKNHGRTSSIQSLDEGDQWLRRRARSRTPYVGPAPVDIRKSRSALPFSYVENRIFDWAEKWEIESREAPTAEYLANLMQRSVDEIYRELELRKTTRNGMESLF